MVHVFYNKQEDTRVMKDIQKDAELLKKLLTGEAGPDEQEQGQRLLHNFQLKQKYEELKLPHLLDKITDPSPAYDADKAYRRLLHAAVPTSRPALPRGLPGNTRGEPMPLWE